MENVLTLCEYGLPGTGDGSLNPNTTAANQLMYEAAMESCARMSPDQVRAVVREQRPTTRSDGPIAADEIVEPASVKPKGKTCKHCLVYFDQLYNHEPY